MGGKMSEPSSEALRTADGSGVLEAQTPYQHTVNGLLVPWRFQLLYDGAAGLALAAIGLPAIALIWVLVSIAADLLLQKLYASWGRRAATTDSGRGLMRLGLCCALRASLWMSGPVAVALLTGSSAAVAYSALTALSMVAIAVSTGWTSRAVWVGFAAPAAAGIVVQALPHASGWPLLGVIMGIASFSATAVLISIGTERTLAEWSRSNARTLAVLDDMAASLRRSEAAERRLRIAAEIADLHVYEVDFVARTVMNHGANRDFLDAPISFERMSKDGFYMVHPDDRESVVAAWEAHEAGGGPYRAKYRLKRQDGREVWAFAAAEISRAEDGRALTLVGALVDITASKRAEGELTEQCDRAEAASRVKSEFLATMSHEIRTPLNGVLGMAQAMAQDELSEAQRHRLGVVQRSGEMLLGLLNNVLDVSKIESAKLELEIGQFDVASLCQEAIDTFAPLLANKDVILSLAIPPHVRGMYRGDAGRVRQVLTNLISNAVKFTDYGSVDVRVDRDGDMLTIDVTDTGIGIAPDQHQALFEKFTQADASTTRRYGGTGLGLSISRQLAQMMDGSIELESQLGRGSTFRVALSLPRLGDEAQAECPEAAPAAGAPQTLQPLRVLAAEDNEVNQLVLRTLLQQVGIEVVIVSDGRQAVEACSTETWDLILMDIQMPVMDGVTAARTIRSDEALAGRTRTPIVALTANVMTTQIEEYRQAGMDAVAAKPIELAKLLEAMEGALAERPEAGTATVEAA
jgi:signal transduction histidine kinase/CheY-like chemotaxis protein